VNDSPFTACGQDAALALDGMPESHDAEFRCYRFSRTARPPLIRTNPQIRWLEAVYTLFARPSMRPMTCRSARSTRRCYGASGEGMAPSVSVLANGAPHAEV
jgi:hypothetical protein